MSNMSKLQFLLLQVGLNIEVQFSWAQVILMQNPIPLSIRLFHADFQFIQQHVGLIAAFQLLWLHFGLNAELEFLQKRVGFYSKIQFQRVYVGFSADLHFMWQILVLMHANFQFLWLHVAFDSKFKFKLIQANWYEC